MSYAKSCFILLFKASLFFHIKIKISCLIEAGATDTWIFKLNQDWSWTMRKLFNKIKKEWSWAYNSSSLPAKIQTPRQSFFFFDENKSQYPWNIVIVRYDILKEVGTYKSTVLFWPSDGTLKSVKCNKP